MPIRRAGRHAAALSLFALTSALAASAAEAQEANDRSGAVQCAGTPEGEERANCLSQAQASGELVVITGTRIARPELAFPNPVRSFTSEQIERRGATNLTNFLIRTPALVGSTASVTSAGNANFFGSAGLNLLGLRNLGTHRTLVLVNGRRHVAGFPGTSTVDVNTIPTDLIERVDVLTGGTSAIYGADAVSGVVNFVLKQDFEGIRARGQIGTAEHGGAGERFASITLGKNFAGSRGNITLGRTRRFTVAQLWGQPDLSDPSLFWFKSAGSTASSSPMTSTAASPSMAESTTLPT